MPRLYNRYHCRLQRLLCLSQTVTDFDQSVLNSRPAMSWVQRHRHCFTFSISQKCCICFVNMFNTIRVPCPCTQPLIFFHLMQVLAPTSYLTRGQREVPHVSQFPHPSFQRNGEQPKLLRGRTHLWDWHQTSTMTSCSSLYSNCGEFRGHKIGFGQQ